MFDVTMGSHDGAEACKLVGLYILNKLSSRFGKNNLGLYRDDGLVLMEKATGGIAEKGKKDLTAAFNELCLKITATAKQKIVNFLDIKLDLNEETYQPYKKPNDDTLYIPSHSNHPPSIIKQLP